MAVKLVKPINHKKVVKITDQDFEVKMNQLRINSDIAIAVSGGPDSLALLHLANSFAKNKKINLITLSVDHGLRSESSKEIEWIKKISKKNQINFHSIKIKKKISESNTLSKARMLRYSALSKYCIEKKIKYLLTAHHLDDEIENFLMRLIRGSGVKGLSSLKYKSRYKNTSLVLVRPLLSCSKKSLISYLSKKKQSYIIDRTNSNKKYDRTRIRKLVEELIKEGLSKARLKNVISNLKSADAAINASVNDYMKKYIKLSDKKIINFRLKKFSNLPEEIQHRALIKLCRFIGHSNKVPRSKSIQELIRLIKKEKKFNFTLNGCVIAGQDGLIKIHSKSAKSIQNTITISQISSNWTESIQHY